MCPNLPDVVNSAEIAQLRRVLDGGRPAVVNADGMRAEIPPQLQSLMGTIVRMLEMGQGVTLFPALADRAAMERMEALDQLSREAYEQGLYDRPLPLEPVAAE